MEKYLLDTNVVSGYLSANFSDAAMAFLDQIIDLTPQISVITQIELLSWKTDEKTEIGVQDFIHDCNVLHLTPEVINHCVTIRRKQKIKTPDAIIAATALAGEMIIVTKNQKDFANVKGLKVKNPESF